MAESKTKPTTVSVPDFDELDRAVLHKVIAQSTRRPVVPPTK
jgi:hypothetical protein